MTAPGDRNRLGDETSPYLREHDDDPINWHPWNEAAFETASERNVPIFLSIGYATCTRCQAMATECFEDSTVVDVLNGQYVPILVDRRQRPDVDHIYQTIGQQVSNYGGWPLSVWLTPQREPFRFEATVSKTKAEEGPGLLTALADSADQWADPDERESIQRRAREWTETATEQLEGVPEDPERPREQSLVHGAKAAVRSADREYGGWGTNLKHPHTARLEVLLRAYERTDRDIYREVATETLDAMATGGLYDHLGGGFHRYATDRMWAVPDFEKRLSDNAELAVLYLTAAQITNTSHYRTVARETLDCLRRELAHDAGGFISSLGAATDQETGEDGQFYLWTPAEIQDVLVDEEPGLFTTAQLDNRDAELFCDRYSVTESDSRGSSVLAHGESVETLMERYDMAKTEVVAALDRARKQLREARDQRPRPRRDETVIAGWNGLAVSAFVAGATLEDEYEDLAVGTLVTLRDRLWDESTQTLARGYWDGNAGVDGFLDDYAFLGRGALDCYRMTDSEEHLSFARSLAATIQRDFWDEHKETLYYTTQGDESSIVRPQELADHSTPSSLAVATEFLFELSQITDDNVFGDIAEEVVATHGSRVRSYPLEHASLTLAADTIIERPDDSPE